MDFKEYGSTRKRLNCEKIHFYVGARRNISKDRIYCIVSSHVTVNSHCGFLSMAESSFCFRPTGNKESTTDSSSSKFDRIRLEAFFFT